MSYRKMLTPYRVDLSYRQFASHHYHAAALINCASIGKHVLFFIITINIKIYRALQIRRLYQLLPRHRFIAQTIKLAYRWNSMTETTERKRLNRVNQQLTIAHAFILFYTTTI